MESNREQQVWAQGQAQAAAVNTGMRSYMLGVYNYMASALVLTGITAWLGANFEPLMKLLYNVQDGVLMGPSMLGWVVTFAPLGLVLWLGAGINRMSYGTAQILFWVYAGLVGLSLSSLAFAYTAESIARTFFITAIAFGGLSLYGYTTKKDLSGWGSFLIVGLIGVIVASIVNIFLQSSGLQFAVSVIGVLVFAGLMAYDTQRIKSMYYQVAGHGEAVMKAALMGALSLYINFINMFVMLLQLFGDRR
jgi:FtsH-binding integral membrane protein